MIARLAINFNPPMNRSPLSFLQTFAVTLFGLLFSTAQPLSAAVIVNPTLATGSGSIAPSGAQAITISASGSTSKSVLETLSGFGVVQNFAGFANGTNIISFTDAQRPAVQISFSGSGNLAASGSALSNVAFASSADSAIRLAADNALTGPNALVGTIAFGSWNGSTFNSNNASVSAVGFTLNAPLTRFDRVNAITVSFLSPTGTQLSIQTVNNFGSTTGVGIYFGYEATGGAAIGSVVIQIDINAKAGSEQQVLIGLDDLGFTAIPEPSQTAMLTIASLALGMTMICRTARRR